MNEQSRTVFDDAYINQSITMTKIRAFFFVVLFFSFFDPNEKSCITSVDKLQKTLPQYFISTFE